MTRNAALFAIMALMGIVVVSGNAEITWKWAFGTEYGTVETGGNLVGG